MGLETVEDNEGKIWDEYVTNLGPERREGHAEGETDLVDKGVEEETRQGRGDVKMWRRGAPIRRLARKDVVAECGEFRPQGKSEPKVGV